ncbi:FlgD immunoglobulin-like domain containing protein [Fulvivirgaceae bacterium BMA12]|uniref:FlgD immunoglobulin-like domain containing protein n=1 Tax=Agaribacillus aureus TaxID=3051825 RepID=A0ABT8LC74_9BACT|nr:FlgD immunoglobulin-like domain containing protein [Fulvivirgaceae bacterium BMA12]
MRLLNTKMKWALLSLSILAFLSLTYFLTTDRNSFSETYPESAPAYGSEYGYEQEESEEEIAFEMAMDKQNEAYDEIDFDDLSPAELAAYELKMQKLKASGFNFAAVLKEQRHQEHMTGIMSYANGVVTGEWQTKLPVPAPKIGGGIGNGYRVDGSVYDPVNDKIYAVSTPGHLYRVSKTGQLQWTLLDHKGKYKKIFFGFNLPNGTFRMVKNEQPEALIGHLSYSDDEGQTWTPATGALLQNNWADNGFKAVVNGNTRLFALGDHKDGANVKTKYVFMSQDLGLTFTESSLNFKSSDHQIQLLKTYHNDQPYLFVRTKATNVITIYKYNDTAGDFQLLHTLSGTYTDFKRALGTFSGGKVHFYIAETPNNIHYSDDEGATWAIMTTTNTKSLKEIHPDQPSTVFRGFVDVNMSTDFGVTFNSFGHKLGWDLRHMTFHQKTNGDYFALIGMDFGCFISDVATDTASYQALNSGAPIALMYDAVSNERFNTVHAGHQDKGASGFLDTAQVVTRKGLAGTDILRISYAKGGESIWVWFYTGKIRHLFNFASPNYIDEKADVASGFGNWTSRNIIPSPDTTEDVIYGAWGNSLQKFTYANGVATKTTHTYDFGKDLSGFGYSTSNTDRWYVSAADGQFFHSNDGGVSFTATTYAGSTPTSGGGYRKGRHVIRVSKTNPDLVFYAGNNKHFLISQDGGVTFSDHIAGFEGTKIKDLAIADGDKYIFAACATAGPWVYSVDDDLWYPMDGPDVPNVDFTDVEFISSKNIVRFATYGTGIQDFILNTTLPGGGGPPGGGTTYYYIENKDNGVKIRPETALDGAKMIKTSSTTTDNWVQWEKIDTDNGFFHLKNRETGKHFKPVGTGDNSLMEQVPDTQVDNWTQWETVDTGTGDGYVHIFNRETGKKIRRLSGSNIQNASASATGDWTRWKLVNTAGAGARLSMVKEAVANEISPLKGFRLEANYPNPFKNKTTIHFTLPQDQLVYMEVYNEIGQKVRTLLDGVEHTSGSYSYQWDGRDGSGKTLPDNTYFIKIKAGRYQATSRAVLRK